MPHDVWTPMRYAVTAIYRNQQRKKQKGFSVLQKKSKAENKKITATFGKSLFLIKYQMRYAVYMPPNTKGLAINRTMVAYRNRQNPTAFGRANNSDLLRSLKHLMKTRLYSLRWGGCIGMTCHYMQIDICTNKKFSDIILSQYIYTVSCLDQDTSLLTWKLRLITLNVYSSNNAQRLIFYSCFWLIATHRIQSNWTLS